MLNCINRQKGKFTILAKLHGFAAETCQMTTALQLK